MKRIRNERGEITTNTTEIHKVIREYYQQLHVNKLIILEEMKKKIQKWNKKTDKTESTRNRQFEKTNH